MTLFSRPREQDGGMSEELCSDATYPMRVCSILVQMPLGDVLELRDFVLRLKKNLILVSYMANHQCKVTFHQCTIAFGGQHCIINIL
jgi:hypothetical protein